MEPPVEKVFGLREFFEQIVCSLPLESVICVKQVCREWRDNIDRYDIIQKHLFLKPMSKPAIATCRLNPLLKDCITVFDGVFDGQKSLSIRYHVFEKKFIVNQALTLSWEAMLFSQPAPRRVTINNFRPVKSFPEGLTAYFAGGVTISDLQMEMDDFVDTATADRGDAANVILRHSIEGGPLQKMIYLRLNFDDFINVAK